VRVNIDDLIRDAVRRQEALAVDPERIRAALPVRTTRRRRSRTLVMLATVGAAIAVVTVPVVMRDAPVVAPPATTAPGPVLPGLITVPLRYHPTWLPPGMAERERAALLPTSPEFIEAQHRTWTNTAMNDGLERTEPYLTMTVTPADHDPRENLLFDSVHAVEVNGRPGWADREAVVWNITDDTMLLIRSPEDEPLPEADLLRIARSVKPDHEQLRAPLRLDWLPDGFETHSVDVRGNSPTQRLSRIIATNGGRFLSVQVGTPVPQHSGEQLTVNGRPATLTVGVDTGPDDYVTGWFPYRADLTLTVNLGDGTYLTVRSTQNPEVTERLSKRDAIKVAENVVVDPAPYLDWLGR
jgi:hypothetical protein